MLQVIEKGLRLEFRENFSKPQNFFRDTNVFDFVSGLQGDASVMTTGVFPM